MAAATGTSQAGSSRTRKELYNNQLIATATIDFASTAANTSTDSSGITVTGAAVGDPVIVGSPAYLAGGGFEAYVSAADTVKVRFSNNTAGALDPASGTYKIVVFKFGNYFA